MRNNLILQIQARQAIHIYRATKPLSDQALQKKEVLGTFLIEFGAYKGKTLLQYCA